MNEPFRIVRMESFRVIGYRLQTTNKKSEGRRSIPKHWLDFKETAKQEKLVSLMNQEPLGVLGISIYNVDSTDSRKFDFFIAVSSDSEENEELKSFTVPACTWAIFDCTNETIGKTEVQAITKILPKSNYRPLNRGYITGRMKSLAPDITYYGKEDTVEVWVAVKEK